ncbi:MAG: hypothetical protein LBE82_09615 [Chitinophagaceae bacterium]|jgi:hypothetical protein|nr:hypothetical protein [Chitinophagaceae bacterium]
MNRNIFKLLFALLFLFVFTIIKAQRIDTLLSYYAAKYPTERMHLHFDRAVYSPGETIWFKAYIMAGALPSNISKSIYVDWADTKGNVLAHQQFPVIESSARGQFEVPAKFAGNAVHVRAYTKWMLNFDSAFLFDKDIRILQKKSVKATEKMPVIEASLQFLPEGGNSVEGLKNKVAFIAIDQFGKPVNIKGDVTDSKGNKIAALKPEHDGMGYIWLQPQAGETYTAKWTDEQNNAHQTILPPALKEGITLQIFDGGNKKIFNVQRTDNVGDNLKLIHIIATYRQQLVYMANINLAEHKTVTSSIPLTEIPQGGMIVTLFDNDWKPLAERITFVNDPSSIFTPEVGFAKLSFNKRGENELIINVVDTVNANLSVSVTDAGLGTDSTDNILSRMLINGDLRGKIYRAPYYFSDTTDIIYRHLDLVMLTHGWRRYNWDKIFAHELPSIQYPADTGYMTFSGKIFGARPDAIRAAGSMVMIIQQLKDSSKQMQYVTPQPDGTFNDPQFVPFDSARVYYTFAANKSMNDLVSVRFLTDKLLPPASLKLNRNSALFADYDTTDDARNRFFAEQQEKILAAIEGHRLQDVTVQSRVKSPTEKLDEKYASGLFKGGDAAAQFDLMNDPFAASSMNVFQYLQGRVAGLQITTNGSDASLSWRGGTPNIYLDEMPADISMAGNIPMTDIAYIKVFRPGTMLTGSGGGGGSIAIYTKKGGDRPVEPGKGLPSKLIEGYTYMKEFYSPNYLSLDPRNEHPDMRSTLYWGPMILTDPQNHEKRIRFFNNDATKSFRIVVEGLAQDGRLTHVEKVLE